MVKYPSALRLSDPLPFSGVEFFPRESMRYMSRIDAGILMRQAREELAEGDGDSLPRDVLALERGATGRDRPPFVAQRGIYRRANLSSRKRIRPVEKSRIHGGQWILTEHGGNPSRIPGEGRDQFVISAFKAGEGEASRAWGNRYRCGTVFEKVNAWLRAHGVEGNKATPHSAKRGGAIVSTSDGIFAASQFFRHGDIATTAAHYADKKTRTVIDMGALLDEENISTLYSPLPTKKRPVTDVKHRKPYEGWAR